MKIKNLDIKELNIPFNVSFKHPSAERNNTEAVLVTIESEKGNVGYGEGCPRIYVTGETVSSALKFFSEHKLSIQNIESVDNLKQWVEKNKESIDKNPAVWCAIEIALLDTLGKEQNQSIEELLSLPPLQGDFHYTAVLGASNLEAFQKQLEQYAHLGFHDFKVKISGDSVEDLAKLKMIEGLENQNTRIRLDANNLWHDGNEAITYLKQLDVEFFAIEEPIKANQYDELSTIAKTLNTRIILDESLLREGQFSEIQASPEIWIINIRISKMGGILHSLSVAKKAKKLGIPIIIGAQVGETSILTRAALTVANTYNDILLAQEGAFGTYLLKEDIPKEPLMFGKNGVLSSNSISAGVGLSF